MPQSPMISVPLKATNEIDWIAPLKEYIRDTYSDDPEHYAEECATLNRLRQDMRGAGKDSTTGRDMLYRYYGQLELLDLRFPVDEQHIKISFTWFDAFTHKSTSQYSLAFEKASIIFNMSAVLSCHAANQNRSEESGLKMAYHSFQAAAGMFTYINDNFLHAPSVDLSRDTVKTLIAIMLAQATEVFLERQIQDQKKNSLLAKLCSQAAYLYGQAVEGVQENVTKAVFEKVWLMMVNIKTNHLGAMAQYYQALVDDDAGNHGVGIARLQAAERMAKDANRTAMSFPSSTPSISNLSSDCGTILQDTTKKLLITVQEALRQLIKDNDYIYTQSVPAEETLNAIPKLPAAKPIPVTELYSGQDINKITGPDLFGKIVPLAVTESASLYDEEKAKLVRAEQERVDINNTELAAALDYLGLPESLVALKGGLEQEVKPDSDFSMWCEDVAGHENPTKIFEYLRTQKTAVVTTLQASKQLLDQEASSCEKMRSKYESQWTQQPSGALTKTLRDEIERYRQLLDDATKTDNTLAAKLRQYEGDFSEMRAAWERSDTDGLFYSALHKAKSNSSTSPAVEQNLLDADFDDNSLSVAEQIEQVEECMKRLNMLKRERNQTLKDLKDTAHKDDISQLLIFNKKSVSGMENQLFQHELEKFQAYQNRLLQAQHKQVQMLKELNQLVNVLLMDKRVKAEKRKWDIVQNQRNLVVNKYKKAYQEFLDLQASLQRAKSWYTEVKSTVESHSKNVTAFVNNRKNEGALLYDQIRQQSEGGGGGGGGLNLDSLRSQPDATTKAELEQERMRHLMSRMSMDNGGNSPQESVGAGRRPSALFGSGQAPRYDGYSHNIPSSPPPNQMHHSSTYGNPTLVGQQPGVSSPQSMSGTAGFSHATAYDPAFYGRNPGPTSPPATQTTFGLGPASPPPQQTTFGIRGPASPPPTQTSFGGAYGGYPQASGSGQQQAMQAQMGQQLNRPPSQQRGYLPPPPPGPPPVGPQQTYHYGGQDYAGSANGGQGGSGSGQAADPWAGLRAWK